MTPPLHGLRGPAPSRRRRPVAWWLIVLYASAAGCGTPADPARDWLGKDDVASREARRSLMDALKPVKLSNCTLERYGDAHDGGYLLCENLLGEAEIAYSYGIEGRDKWGCDVSSRLLTWVHEYDCFNPTRPVCDKGGFLFHDECIGDKAERVDNRPFDTLANQIARNGDAGKRLIVKMDVEGAEWASLLATPDEVLDRIDQLVIEIHGTDAPRFKQTIDKLKRVFHVAHFHANNATCDPSFAPLTSWANEVLFVNKRLGVLDPSGGSPTLPDPLDAPNHPEVRDCQPRF